VEGDTHFARDWGNIEREKQQGIIKAKDGKIDWPGED